MSCPVNFSEDTLSKQWQYVKRNLADMGILNQTELEDIEAKAHQAIEAFFQQSIFAEFNQQIRAEEYEHTPERYSIPSGTYSRIFTTTFGKTKLLIPKVRKKSRDYTYKLLAKYQRRQRKFDDMVVLSLLLGFSTRKQKRFFQAFIGDSVSHQTASKLIQSLFNELRLYQTRPIEDKYRFIIIDALWIDIKELDIKKRPILFALGITKDGKQEVIAFKLAKGETEEEYTNFLNDLYRRGLLGKSLELIISDGSEAIISACNTVYPYTPRQRCYTHKLRNLLQNIRHKTKHRAKMARQARRIFQASSRQEAIRRFRIFVNRWKDKEPRAIKCFQDEFYHTLNFYDFPKEIRSVISTTNYLERFLEEIRRRIKIQGYFKNERSLNLWIFGIIKYIELKPIKALQPKRSFKYESAKNS
jgi:transposase-like protein